MADADIIKKLAERLATARLRAENMDSVVLEVTEEEFSALKAYAGAASASWADPLGMFAASGANAENRNFMGVPLKVIPGLRSAEREAMVAELSQIAGALGKGA